MTGIVESFFKHTEGNLLLHLESYTLSPKNFIEIYEDKRFIPNETEYHIFSVLLFQKIESHTRPDEFWVNSFFKIVHTLTMNMGLYYGKQNTTVWDMMVQDYKNLEESLAKRQINFAECIENARQTMELTIEKTTQHIEDKTKSQKLKITFLEPCISYTRFNF